MLQGKVQSHGGSCCSDSAFEMQDSMVAAEQPLTEAFHCSSPVLLLSLAVHSSPLCKMLLSPSHVELFPNDKLKNGFTTVKFKEGLDRLQWATSNCCKCFNANLFPLNLSALMGGWTLDLLSIWGGGGMKIHGFGGNQGDYKSTKNPCGSTGQDPVVLEPHWYFYAEIHSCTLKRDLSYSTVVVLSLVSAECVSSTVLRASKRPLHQGTGLKVYKVTAVEICCSRNIFIRCSLGKKGKNTPVEEFIQ